MSTYKLNTESLNYKLLSTKKEYMDLLDKMIQWEQGELSDKESTDLFGELIKNRLAWQLQGMYGRFAQSLIRAGYLTEDGHRGPNYSFDQ